MTIRKAFGKTVKTIRQSKNLTQNDCSTALGKTQAQWSAYELGKTDPSLETMLAISIVLDITVLELLSQILLKTKPLN